MGVNNSLIELILHIGSCNFENLLCDYWFSFPGFFWEYARGGSITNSLVSPVFDHTLGSTEGKI